MVPNNYPGSRKRENIFVDNLRTHMCSTADLEAKMKETKWIVTPTIYVSGAADGVNPLEAAKDVSGKFSGPFEAVPLHGVDHFPTRKALDAIAAALIRHFGHASVR